MSDAFDVIIGVSVGLLMLFTLLCGCAVCNDPTPSTENSRIPTRNNTLSANNRVQIEGCGLKESGLKIFLIFRYGFVMVGSWET